MTTNTTTDLAERIISTVRAHETELRRAGICGLSLFGSVARGDAAAASDIDLAVVFDPAARMDLFRLVALERRIAEILGRHVDLVPEPVETPRLRANIDRDGRHETAGFRAGRADARRCLVRVCEAAHSTGGRAATLDLGCPRGCVTTAS
jgi:uncharacterized protein